MAVDMGNRHDAAAIWRVPALIAGAFAFVRVALQHRSAVNEIDRLSDRYLRDIGVDRLRISDTIKAEISRTHLLDTGWARRSKAARR